MTRDGLWNPRAPCMKLNASVVQRLWLKTGRRLKARFYIYLAVVFTVFVFADTFLLGITAKMKQSSFDMMIRHRLVVSRPDPEIVILDINEASLAAMAKDYGRWPWPRQVMGEFLEQVESQRPKAVVFDILFSDPDVYNADSDAYFNEAVGRTGNTFFPMLRLDPASDSLSSLMPSQLPGAVPVQGEARNDKPVAMVMPFFDTAVKGGRLGLHNIYPDSDGVTREYTVYRKDYGWLLPSLPARVAGWLGVKLPAKDSILINWRGKPFTYRYVSFADVYLDMLNKDRKRPKDEFTGKIIIIGSTAAGLFDVKATPMDRLFPGVEILATALDNLKNNDYLRVPDTKLFNLALALLIVWATALAMYKNIGQDIFGRVFGASQFMLIGISYASINLLTTYINLTGPVMVGVAFFSCAKLYALGARKALERSAVMSSVLTEGELYAAVMLVRLGAGHDPAADKAAARLQRVLGKRLRLAKSIETLKGAQKGIWGLFEGTVVVSWTCPAGDEKRMGLIRQEASSLEKSSSELLRAGRDMDGVSVVFHEGRLAGGESARAGWAVLFGEALAKQELAGRDDK